MVTTSRNWSWAVALLVVGLALFGMSAWIAGSSRADDPAAARPTSDLDHPPFEDGRDAVAAGESVELRARRQVDEGAESGPDEADPLVTLLGIENSLGRPGDRMVEQACRRNESAIRDLQQVLELTLETGADYRQQVRLAAQHAEALADIERELAETATLRAGKTYVVPGDATPVDPRVLPGYRVITYLNVRNDAGEKVRIVVPIRLDEHPAMVAAEDYADTLRREELRVLLDRFNALDYPERSDRVRRHEDAVTKLRDGGLTDRERQLLYAECLPFYALIDRQSLLATVR